MQPTKKKRSNLSRLLDYAKPHKWWFLLILALVFLTAAASLVEPYLIRLLIDNHLSAIADQGADSAMRSQAVSGVIRISLIYLFMVMGSFVLSYALFYLLHRTGQRILRTIRQGLYDHILRFPMAYFDKHPIGSLVTRVTNDTEALNELFTSVLTNLTRSFFTLAGIILIMFQLNAKIAGLAMLSLPFVVLISVIFRRVIRIVYEQQRKVLSTINTKLSENISGIAVIQTFFREKSIYEEFNQVNHRYLDLAHKEITYFAIYRPAIEIVRSLGLAALLWFGGVANMEGAVTFGVLYAFTDYFQRFFRPILNFAETFNVIQSAMTSTNRIFKLMDEPVEDNQGKRQLPEGGLRGEIEFDHVWFRYNKEEEEPEWILKDVSFHIQPGQFVAFVGATGAGKTTIMSLLSRFYTVDKGRILLDGVNINEYDLAALRRGLGVVQQDVFLFTGNILGNIAIGRESVGRAEAIEAAKLVHAHEFISQLPHGYDQPVTERGSTLSAGQRQLLSFARIIAGNPSLLILDEATSNIDTETEILIQKAILNMAKNRTMLAVAHRISTIADADLILVMHHGRLAESGTRRELLEKDGLFRVLYELQYQAGKGEENSPSKDSAQ